MKEISYSRVSSYRQCPFKHYLSYVEKIELNQPVKALSFGSDFHKLLQFKDNTEDLKKAISEIVDTYENLDQNAQSVLGDDYIDNLMTVFKDYMEVNSKALIPNNTELEFNIPFARIQGEEISFKGIIDEVYDNAIGEHKTFSMKPDMLTLSMNTQVCLYAKAMRKLQGKTPKQVIWDYTKSSPASSPIWLVKSSRLSEAKSSQITPMSWTRACEEHEITDPKILALKKMYEPNISNYYFKVVLDINRPMVNKIWQDFKDTAIEIVKHGETNKIQNVTRDCSWCNYKDICYTGFTGGDVNYTKEKNYREKTRR